jgi:hypothetical protein
VNQAPAQSTGHGFLFGRPGAIFTLHGGFGQPNANSDVFTFVTDQLTLSDGDFAGFAGGAGILIPVAEQVDLSLSATYMGRSTGSEFRDWVDNDDLPIEQRTDLIRVPLLAGARYYVLPRGKSIGNLAWVPSRVSAHVGAAGGTTWYRFRQVGDFVDFEDNAIFFDELLSDGWTPAGQLSAGLDVSVTTRLGLTAEASHLWSRATLSRDFEQFDPIDLSGFSVLVGISLRV